MKTSNYQYSQFMGELHTFTTEEKGDVFYKYLFNPKMRETKFANYLEIEKYKEKKLFETIMVSSKQIVYYNVLRDKTWMKMFKTGNEYLILKHYTKKEGAEWKIEKKNENKTSMINLEYDVKSSIIDKCLKITQ